MKSGDAVKGAVTFTAAEAHFDFEFGLEES